MLSPNKNIISQKQNRLLCNKYRRLKTISEKKEAKLRVPPGQFSQTGFRMFTVFTILFADRITTVLKQTEKIKDGNLKIHRLCIEEQISIYELVYIIAPLYYFGLALSVFFFGRFCLFVWGILVFTKLIIFWKIGLFLIICSTVFVFSEFWYITSSKKKLSHEKMKRLLQKTLKSLLYLFIYTVIYLSIFTYFYTIYVVGTDGFF